MDKATKYTKRYSATLKWQAALEAIKGKDTAQVGKMFNVHPTSVGHWKNYVLETGPTLFQATDTIKKYEDKITQMEQLLGKKEVEIAFLKNFLTPVN